MSWVTRVLSKLDGRELPPAEWLRVGWPRAALALVVMLPIILAGPVRFVTQLPFAAAYVVATLVSLLALAPFARALSNGGVSRRRELAATVAVALVAAFAAAAPYNRHFHGLPNYIGADHWMAIDGAYHLWNYFDFTRRPAIYGGFVSLYSLWDAFHRLGSTHFLVAINAGFIYARIIVAVGPCLVAFALLRAVGGTRSAWWSGALACVVSSVAVQYAIILPLETFHMMGGFWSHLFGVVPTMALWLADALVRQRLLRILALLGAGVLYRYTYGLNLADVAATIGALLVLEALGRSLPAWLRALLVAGALSAWFGARYCFLLTAPLFRNWGWIVQHDVDAAGAGQLLALAAFAVTIGFGRARSELAGSGVTRALRVPLLFGAANLLFIHFIHGLPTGTFYYFIKYDLHALVIVASGAVVAVSFWVAVCVRRFSLPSAIAAALAVALLALGLARVHAALAPYQQGFREQLVGGDYERTQPWVIPAAVRDMDRLLAREKKRFGGYLSKRLPLYLFTNAIFDRALPDWQGGRRLDPTPGTCVFWDDGQYAQWDAVEKKQCNRYVQQPYGRYEICAACY